MSTQGTSQLASDEDLTTVITPLSEAATSGNAAIVRLLLESGADIHASYGCGGTVMEAATTNDIVQIFLDRGLDINGRDKFGGTILIISAEGSRRPSIAFLLAHGADPNARTDDGMTALKVAQGFGKTDEVELLKKACARE